jgi:hypothetical protein
MTTYRVLWGDTHNNTHQTDQMPVPYAELIERAATHLDFYAAAYYTARADAFSGQGHLAEREGRHNLILEEWKSPERIAREWAEVQAVTRALNAPGRFVTFPGYEWQGDGSSGDHNVFMLHEGGTVYCCDTLPELYARIRGQDALVIPHHIAYPRKMRGKNWDEWDPVLSPVCEIFSIHGCSETDEELIGLRQNSHMGPGFGAGTWESALARGLRVGAIASSDSWRDMPGPHGRGLAAVLATSCTREAIWDAFAARRTYAVTGDRILLEFTCNGAPMGSEIAADGPRRLRVAVDGMDALDRIELLRNGRVIATHCHQGTWDLPRPGTPTRFRLRLEAGWGPRPNEMPVQLHPWQGCLTLARGRFTGWSPCWISPGQGRPVLDGGEARFSFLTSTDDVRERSQNATVFEFDADPADALSVTMNGLAAAAPVAEYCAASRELWYRDDCIRMLAEQAGIPPGSPQRDDIYHHCAFKAKIHRAIPEAGYRAAWEVTDDSPVAAGTHYRVRVEQRNGQRAWSSPIWVMPSRRG